MSAGYYLVKYEHKSIAHDAPATILVLQQPAHGTLRLETEANHFGTGRFDPASPSYAYLPSDHYLGNDKAILLVDFGDGLKVKVIYYFQAIEGLLGNTGLDELCSETGYRWKISSTLDANGTNTITSVECEMGSGLVFCHMDGVTSKRKLTVAQSEIITAKGLT